MFTDFLMGRGIHALQASFSKERKMQHKHTNKNNHRAPGEESPPKFSQGLCLFIVSSVSRRYTLHLVYSPLLCETPQLGQSLQVGLSGLYPLQGYVPLGAGTTSCLAQLQVCTHSHCTSTPSLAKGGLGLHSHTCI